MVMDPIQAMLGSFIMIHSNSWVQVQSDIDGENGSNYSGRAVSLNAAGDRVAIGGRSNDGGGTNSATCACTI